MAGGTGPCVHVAGPLANGRARAHKLDNTGTREGPAESTQRDYKKINQTSELLDADSTKYLQPLVQVLLSNKAPFVGGRRRYTSEASVVVAGRVNCAVVTAGPWSCCRRSVRPPQRLMGLSVQTSRSQSIDTQPPENAIPRTLPTFAA